MNRRELFRTFADGMGFVCLLFVIYLFLLMVSPDSTANGALVVAVQPTAVTL
tara:strand:+ start:967 stop:1122 length:156 start_codon:yes stop_codon:yes gene_type:complete